MEKIKDFDKYFKKKSFIQKYAFSLIELSIVLIIIGLLVAGVSGGASLIESAKVRGLINEFNGYKQAVHTFYAAKGRLPGDLNRDGIIGYARVAGKSVPGETYTTNSFPAPYNVKAPRYETAPFIDLYLEKVIDFEPNPNYVSNIYMGTSVPLSKISKKSYYSTFRTWADTKNSCFPCFPSSGITLNLNNGNSISTGISVKIVKKFDEKIDDGVAMTGNVYSHGVKKPNSGARTYEEMEDGYLSAIMYKVFDY